ncbi:hypothetical protein BH11CYA1_BH11CYA1_49960 [soil metagenome]
MKDFSPNQYKELFSILAKGLFDLGFIAFDDGPKFGNWKKKIIGLPPATMMIFHDRRSFSSESFIRPSSNAFSTVVSLNGYRNSEGLTCAMVVEITLLPLFAVIKKVCDSQNFAAYSTCGGGDLEHIAFRAGEDFKYPRILPEDDQAATAGLLLSKLIDFGLPWATAQRSESEILDGICDFQQDKVYVIACLLYRGLFDRAKNLLEKVIAEREENIRICLQALAPKTREEVEEHLVSGNFTVSRDFIQKVNRICDERSLKSVLGSAI